MSTTNTCKKCGCQDSFMPSPAPCPTPIGCPTPQPCSEVFDAQCVVYTGPDIVCNTTTIIESGSSMTEALIALINYIQTLDNVNCDPFVCINAYIYLTNYSIDNASEEQSSAEVFDRLLDIGLILPIDSNSICCPACGPYVLASVETYLKFAEAWCLTEGNSCVNTCCTNVYAGTETYAKYFEAIGDDNTCQNGFSSETLALTNLLTSEEVNRLLDKGIVENGSLNTNLTSNVSDFTTMVQTFFQSTFSTSSLIEIIDRILDKGLVIYCTNDNVVMASVETFLQYSETNGIIPRPCCGVPA
jgi:hypothetical protein